jgi:ABC-2 type transport system permease protein
VNPIVVIALKDLRQLLRDKMGLFWAVGFPLAISIFFASVFSTGGAGAKGSMRVDVVNDDGSEFSRMFIERLKKREALFVLDADLGSAEKAVRKGKVVAYVHLTKGFGSTMGLFGGGKKAIEMGIDPSRKAEAGFLQGMVVQSLFEAMRERLSDKAFARGEVKKMRDSLAGTKGLASDQTGALGKFLGDLDQFFDSATTSTYLAGFGGDGETSGSGAMSFGVEAKDVARSYTGQPRSPFDITFPSGILWGMVGCASTFAISMVSERRRGTWQRLRAAPVTSAQLLAGKGLACFIACVCDIVLLVGVGVCFFHLHTGNPLLLALAAACTAACFVGAMMLVSVLGRTEASVSGAGWAIFIVWMMFGGGMIPLIAMPGWMQKASYLSPARWGVYSLEGAIWRDFALSEMLVPCAILLAAGVAMFAFGCAILRRTEN